jgi:hypothetical protein
VILGIIGKKSDAPSLVWPRLNYPCTRVRPTNPLPAYRSVPVKTSSPIVNLHDTAIPTPTKKSCGLPKRLSSSASQSHTKFTKSNQKPPNPHFPSRHFSLSQISYRQDRERPLPAYHKIPTKGHCMYLMIRTRAKHNYDCGNCCSFAKTSPDALCMGGMPG